MQLINLSELKLPFRNSNLKHVGNHCDRAKQGRRRRVRLFRRADQSPSDLHLHVTVALAAALELEVKRLRNVAPW